MHLENSQLRLTIVIMTIIGEAEQGKNLQYERLEWNSNPTKLQYICGIGKNLYIIIIIVIYFFCSDVERVLSCEYQLVVS